MGTGFGGAASLGVIVVVASIGGTVSNLHGECLQCFNGGFESGNSVGHELLDYFVLLALEQLHQFDQWFFFVSWGNFTAHPNLHIVFNDKLADLALVQFLAFLLVHFFWVNGQNFANVLSADAFASHSAIST